MSDTKRPSLFRANLLALILTLVGSTQMLGYIFDVRALRGLGAMTCAAPFPKVFSDVDGLETFASTFLITGVDGVNKPFSMQVTPEVYSQLEGCYNRRNVYGAALSYAPRMPRELWTTVFCYGLGPDGPLRKELGLPTGAHDLKVSIYTKTHGRFDEWHLDPSCAE